MATACLSAIDSPPGMLSRAQGLVAVLLFPLVSAPLFRFLCPVPPVALTDGGPSSGRKLRRGVAAGNARVGEGAMGAGAGTVLQGTSEGNPNNVGPISYSLHVVPRSRNVSLY